MRMRCLLACCLPLGWGGPAAAQSNPLTYRPVPYSQLKYGATVRQRFDFSCGGAALATILTHYLGRPTTEPEVLDQLRKRYPTKEAWLARAKDGFSFDDLVFAAGELGYSAQGARVSLEELERLAGPVIVYLKKETYDHFVVLRKAYGGQFYVSDPMSGLSVLNEPTFRKEYSGVALAVWDPKRNLPASSRLTKIRDGLSVNRSIWGGIGNVQPAFSPPFN